MTFGNQAVNDQTGKEDGGADAYERMQQQINDDSTQETNRDSQTRNREQSTDEHGNDKGNTGKDPEEEEEEDPESLQFFLDDQPLASPAADEFEEQEGDTDLVRTLRGKLKEYSTELKTLKSSAGKSQTAAPVNLPEEVPPMPKLGDDGIDWDSDKLEAAINEWAQTRDQIQQRNSQRETTEKALRERLNTANAAYMTERKKVEKVPGYVKAEQIATAEIPQGIRMAVLMTSKNPTGLVMALGSNAKLRQELIQTAENDPVAFGYMIADLDKRTKRAPSATRKDVSSAPEVKGDTSNSTVLGLEKAIDDARAKGDYTAVIRLKKQLKQRTGKK